MDRILENLQPVRFMNISPSAQAVDFAVYGLSPDATCRQIAAAALEAAAAAERTFAARLRQRDLLLRLISDAPVVEITP